MKTSIAFSLAILAWAAILRAEEGFSVEDAMKVLESSLNKRDRINAVAALRNFKERAAPATAVLGQIIATDPTGDEAGYAAEALGHIGKPSIPIVAMLVPNGFEFSYVCATRTIRRFPPELEADLVAAIEPTLSAPYASDRFNGILALRWFNLSPDSANRLARAQIDDRPSKLEGALFLAPRANDPSILSNIESHPLRCMKYLGANLREKWRRRDSPIHQDRRRSHVGQPLPEDEQERCASADAKLAELAAAAIPEALEKLRSAHGVHEKYLWMETLKALSAHSNLPREKTVEVLDNVWRERGSLVDLMLTEFRDEVSSNSEQGDAPYGGRKSGYWDDFSLIDPGQ
jgi:hypothetical protein